MLFVAAVLCLAGTAPASPALAVSHTAAQNGPVIITPGNPIEIAVALDFNWPTVQDWFDAVEMAFADYGDIKGFALQQNHYDAGCDTPNGENAANAIVANAQNAGVIGPLCSSSTVGAAPIFEANGFVMISPSNTGSSVPSFGPNIFNRVVLEDPYFEDWEIAIESLASVQSWQADFLAQYGRQPDLFAKYTYDATTLLLTRIKQVSKLNGGNLEIDRAKLATAVRDTFDFRGVTGQIALAFNGNRVNTLEQAVRLDPFASSTLGEAWYWMDEDPTHWSLTARPGFMRIITQEPAHNWLLRRAPDRDFEIRTHLYFKPAENYQFAGLTVFLDGENHLSFGRAFCDTSHLDCVGNGIYYDHVEGGQMVGSNYATATSVQNEVYLRIVRQEASYTGYFSTNGMEWIEVGTHGIGFKPAGIGLYARNQSAVSEIPADFDYFALSHQYLKVFLPVAVKK
jgi:hypothetical protein